MPSFWVGCYKYSEYSQSCKALCLYIWTGPEIFPQPFLFRLWAHTTIECLKKIMHIILQSSFATEERIKCWSPKLPSLWKVNSFLGFCKKVFNWTFATWTLFNMAVLKCVPCNYLLPSLIKVTFCLLFLHRICWVKCSSLHMWIANCTKVLSLSCWGSGKLFVSFDALGFGIWHSLSFKRLTGTSFYLV